MYDDSGNVTDSGVADLQPRRNDQNTIQYAFYGNDNMRIDNMPLLYKSPLWPSDCKAVHDIPSAAGRYYAPSVLDK